MRFTRFLSTAFRSARSPAPPDELDAFRSERMADDEVVAGGDKFRLASWRLKWVIAALALVEAVPAGLWFHQAFAAPEATVTTSIAPVALVPIAAEPESCETPPPSEPTSSAAQARSRNRSSSAGGTSATVPATVPGAVGGRIAVVAPVPMHIYARGRIVGTTEAETVMLPVGTHELSFVSDAAGYQVRRTVTVQAGRTTRIELEVPSATVNVNASPWAEVWVDQRRVGDTPIANLQLPIGPREFLFRHPELGERRKAVVVTLKEPVRISMDMRTK